MVCASKRKPNDLNTTAFGGRARRRCSCQVSGKERTCAEDLGVPTDGEDSRPLAGVPLVGVEEIRGASHRTPLHAWDRVAEQLDPKVMVEISRHLADAKDCEHGHLRRRGPDRVVVLAIVRADRVVNGDVDIQNVAGVGR